jgi:TonB family protein
MPYLRKLVFSAAVVIFMTLICGSLMAKAQTPLTYPEINTALQTKLPNRSFKNKTELISWIVIQIKNRKMDKPLTKDREDDLRQAGATDELIGIIRTNSPKPLTQNVEETVVDLGELIGRATNLVRPEYTPEAKQAAVNGIVRLQLTLDEQGHVISTKTISSLPNGLTENAVAAAKSSIFTPALVNGKPARAVGFITYNFKVNRPDISSALLNADGYRNKADCDNAISEYGKIIAADAKQPKAYFGRGLCYLMKTSYENATTDFDSTIGLNQSDADAFFYLGVAYDYQGEPVKAAKSYDRAVSINPELGKQVMTDCLYIDRRQVTRDEAQAAGNGIVKACNAFLKSSPEFLTSLVYVKRGIGYRLKGDYDEAIADFETARRLNPRFTSIQIQLHSAYNGRGLMHFNRKEYKEAFNDITTAININPQSSPPYVNRCVIYLYAWKQYDQAIDDCSAAIRLTPNKSSMAYNHRGYAYEMKKNLNYAVADYKKALEIDPQNETARANLSRIQPSMAKPKL